MIKRKTHSLNRKNDAIGVALVTLWAALVHTQAFAQDASTWLPPVRDTSQIVLDYEETAGGFGVTWELDYYVNGAYGCGISGNYSFLVMNPADDPTAEAPLWVYMHGGGMGYYDDQQIYRTLVFQNENTWNHQETFSDLWDGEVRRRTVDDNNQPIDQTLARRIQEGYRLLVVSMCDHDLFSGVGTPYLNNPNGGEVNGLEGTMAAVDYVVANYPTTHVFTHGTSAGASGVWALSFAYAAEGTPLTAGIADFIITERWLTTHAAVAGNPGYPFGPEFEPLDAMEKVGIFLDLSLAFHPIAQVEAGFDDTPVLFMGGDADPFCAGNQPDIPEAVLAGLSNCDWMAEPLVDAVANQPSPPHEVWVLDGEGHVPTNTPGPANDIVDDFIDGVLATNPPYPFAGSPTPVPLLPMPGVLALALSLLAGGSLLARSTTATRHHQEES